MILMNGLDVVAEADGEITYDDHEKAWRVGSLLIVDVDKAFVVVPPSPGLADYQDAVQAGLDAKAQERYYSGILSLCTYVTSANPVFAAEGQAGVGWRDSAWAKCYQVLGEVTAGTRPQPTVAELLAELPAMVWPA